MLRVNGITDSPKQKSAIILADGTTITLILEYKPLQIGWFITQMIYEGFEINNVRVVTSPNMLHQFKNQIPFGIGVFVQDNQEPTLQSDFSGSRAQLFVLSREEVIQYGEFLSG